MKNGLALVIGNIDCTSDGLNLINAVSDSKAITRKLQWLGFVVDNKNNITTEEFHHTIRKFERKLANFKIAVFFYAWYGLQIEGQNYLTGVDTSFQDESSAIYTSLNLAEVVKRMQVKNADIKVLILDACRDNPLPKMWCANNGGLAPVYVPKGTLIAFSTSPGERAMDFRAGNYSVYTGALLSHIDDPNISIEEFFKRVHTSVFAHSNGKQLSWEHTSLIGDFAIRMFRKTIT